MLSTPMLVSSFLSHRQAVDGLEKTPPSWLQLALSWNLDASHS
jgi:hypothetical protein